MKKVLLLSSALTFGCMTAAHAGGLAEPITTETVIVDETTSSSGGGLVVPLLLLLVIAAAAASGGSGGGGGLASDMRLKEDITRIGTNHLGLPVYTFRYKGLPDLFEGVMAQDVEVMHPTAITALPYGYKAVDYAKLGLSMKRVH